MAPAPNTHMLGINNNPERRKHFFFEKKKQKTFGYGRSVSGEVKAKVQKSCSFFQKRTLP
jgi:hypothetical protein